jgi:hypothetical protein
MRFCSRSPGDSELRAADRISGRGRCGGAARVSQPCCRHGWDHVVHRCGRGGHPVRGVLSRATCGTGSAVPRLLIVIGLVAGFGYAAKYTAFLAVPYAAGFVLWRTRRLKPALIVAACSLVLIVPWMLKNILWVGNPFSPMFNAWFRTRMCTSAWNDTGRSTCSTTICENRWTVPLEITMWGQRLCGFLGPVLPVDSRWGCTRCACRRGAGC